MGVCVSKPSSIETTYPTINLPQEPLKADSTGRNGELKRTWGNGIANESFEAQEEKSDAGDDQRGNDSESESEEIRRAMNAEEIDENEQEDEKVESDKEEEKDEEEEENESDKEEEEDSEAEAVDESDQNNDEDDRSSIESDDEIIAHLKDKEIQKDIVMGHVNIQVPSQVHLVRIFTSSTFTDTKVERNTLMERTYPKLKEYCQSIGYDFQVVDMRWGVRDEATDDHMTSELCMRELKACQKLSTGPNFITFLGQKYGYRPFPPKIEASEFEKMLSAVETEDGKSLFERWFERDDNCIPALYILRSISSGLPHYNNEESSKEERRAASNEWWSAFERMQVILRTAASKVLKDDLQKRKYFISVTEDEISRGILSAHNTKKHCYWFKRTINDLKEKISMPQSRFFIDKAKEGVDSEAHDLLNALKDDRMSKTLPVANVKEYNINWAGENGVSVEDDARHQEYIDTLCTDFQDTLTGMIDDGIKERKEKELDDPLIREISQHTTNCQEKTRIFCGHDDILGKIANYIDGETTKPLILYGESGCGKTSLMAMAARQAKERYPETGVILRFLGTTADSSTIGKALHNVCLQLSRICETDPETRVPEQFKKLYEYFAEQLTELETKVIIFLDSLDQLSSEDGAHTMHWLPKELPPMAKIILSTLPGEEYHVFPYLKARFSGRNDVFVEVPKMPDSTATEVLDAWLKDAMRTLTPYQKELVMETFKKMPLPLFLKLSFDEAVRWKSYTPKSDILLEESIKAAINKLFERLERLHGHMLVSHALGYITASKNGLSDAEIDDLLSIDDDVLNDVYQYWTPPVRRIPPLLWVRARTDLGSYVVSRGADSILVNQWYHRQFVETARERYLTGDVAQTLHHNLAEYFLGVWSDKKKKPFTSKSGETDEKDRIVPAQPNIFSKEGSSDVVFNLRKLNELPRHLIKSSNLDTLKKEVIFNFDFLLSKLRGTNLRNVLEDFNETMEAFPGDRDIKLLFDCIQMSARALYNDPYQLGAQLVARLSDYQGNQTIQALLEQVVSSRVLCLYPTITCFEKPGGPLVHSLAGHTAMVDSACLSVDGKRAASVASDQTLKIWNMHTGGMVKSIDLNNSISDLLLLKDANTIVLCGYSGLRLMEINTEEVLFEEEYIMGQHGRSIALSENERYLAHCGGEKVTVFTINGRTMKKQRCDDHKTDENKSGFYDFLTGGGNFFAYTRGSQNLLFVRKFDDASFKKTIKPPKPILGGIFTKSGKELVALTSGSSASDTNKEVRLVIWDTRTWDVVQDRQSKYHHMIIQVSALSIAELPSGPELIWPAMFQILFWNLNTGKERITLRSGYQGSQYKEAQVADGRHMLITSMDFNMHALQVYDLDALEYDEGGNQHLTDMQKAQVYVGEGERDMVFADDGSNLALSMPPADYKMSVWDVSSHIRIRRIIFDGNYPSGFYCIDKELALMFDYQSRKAFIVNHATGKMGAVTDGHVSEITPTVYTNSWEHLGNLQFVMFDVSMKKLNLWDMNTGKLVKTLEPGWKHEIASMMVSKNKSTLVISVKDYSQKLKQHPLLFYHLKNDKKVTYEEKEVHLDLRPEVRGITADGKYFLSVSNDMTNINVIDTQTGKVVKKLEYKATGDEEVVESTNVMCIGVGKSSGIAVGSMNCTISIGGEYINQYRLVVWDINTGEVLAWIPASYFAKMFLSKDDNRLFTTSQAVHNETKTAQLWDMSQIRQGKISLIGSFMPETDLRFSYLSPDGEHMCVGIANIPDIVFLRPCGWERVRRQPLDHLPEYTVKPGLAIYKDGKK